MISEQLKKYRHNAQLSQDDVARALNVSRQAVSRWENQRTYPDIDNLVRLGKLYSVPVDTLLSEDVDIQKGLSHNNEHINDLKKQVHF
ncbi:helix-turn-helix domain-containing protein [Lactiplantibacillus pentosus]|uniref:helix-turn-helix domain-containing protein n=1 Tax=Lactiplantibacillus pentosus TaxID=1589 RepID=UPI001CD38EDD|nr:helix-turn-helix transcriptional regulator [Lactiplantibacillus pentosus]MCJ8185392.1 helix-turn-helix domain-containing protein [Lactiplantibacillus pentosus]